MYLPAGLIYGDPVQYGFAADHFANYQIANEMYQLAAVGDGAFSPIYTMGLAILWLPFFLVAHAVAGVAGAWPADGLSLPYQLAVLAATLCYVGLGIRFLAVFLGRFCSERVTWLTIGALLLGTNLFNYTFLESGMPHAYLFAGYALLLEYSARWHDRPTAPRTVVIGVIIGLMCLCRPSEGIALLLPLLYGVHDGESARAKWQLIRRHWHYVLLLALTGIVIISPQIMYWRTTIGRWFFNGYAEHHFDWFSPHLWDGLFSYRKGWLLYTPLMVLALIGLIPLYRRRRAWFWPVAVYLVVNTYIVLSWHIWWYAGSFGMRALVQSYAVLSLPLAVLVAAADRSWRRWPVYGILAACTVLNLFQTWQYHNRILLNDEMTATYYRDAWGRTEFSNLSYQYIDVDERYPGAPPADPEIIAAEPCVSDTLAAGRPAETMPPDKEFGCTIALTLDAAQAGRLSGQWVSVFTEVYLQNDRFDQYRQARLALTADRAGEMLHYRALRLESRRELNRWVPIRYETRLPELREGDVVKAYIWNTSPDRFFVSKMGLEWWASVD